MSFFAQRQVQIQVKTHRTILLEYLRFLGNPGPLTAAQIAAGVEMHPREVRRVLNKMKHLTRGTRGRARTYEVPPAYRSAEHQPAEELDLAPIKARLAAAAPGPWVADVDDDLWTGKFYVNGDSGDTWCTYDACNADELPNVRFVEAAPADIAALVAEVERLRAR